VKTAALFFFAALFSASVLALPKAGMTLNEPWIQTTDDGGVFTLVYPSATAGQVECTAADLDGASWRDMFRNAQILGAVPLSTFIAALPPAPGSVNKTTDPVVQARCAAIRDLMAIASAPAPTPPPAVPAVYIIVAPNAGRPDRPLYADGLTTGTSAFTEIGRVEILLNGAPRVCEPTPIVYKTESTVKYYYVTNNANQRGLAVCKPN
jgi:hypothetical protein